MISLQPQSQYIIVRHLQDPGDVDTHYVRAVVRNSVNDTVLKTVNLTDKGSNRFKATYEVPADISGVGFYIDITTSVYDDSGYTTKSTVYGEELEQYLVFDRITKMSGGGHGGSDVDYKKIQKMLDKLIESLPKVEQQEIDLVPVTKMLTDIKDVVSGIKPKEVKPIELTPLLVAIKKTESAIIKAIDDKEVTPDTDLSPAIDAIDRKQFDFSPFIAKVDAIKRVVDSFVNEMNTMKDNKNTDEENSSEKLRQMSDVVMPILSKTSGSNENRLSKRVKNLIN